MSLIIRMLRVCAAVAVLIAPVWAQATSPLKLVQTIEVPNVKGRFDHFAIDVKGQRIFLTGEHYHSVEIIDLAKGKWIHRIEGLEKPHAIYYRPQTNELLVTDEDGTCRIYRGDSYKLIKTIKLTLDYNDGVRYDPADDLLYVVNARELGHFGEAASYLGIIDPKKWEHIGDIKLDGNQIEAVAIEHQGPRLFVCVGALKEIAVVDRQKRLEVARWPLGGGGGRDYAVAMDDAHHRLFVVTRAPGELLVLDAGTGKLITSLSTSEGADDVFYDPEHKRIYISSGDSSSKQGHIDVYQQLDANHYKSIQTISTGSPSATGLFAPELNRYYAASVQNGEKNAQLQIYEVAP